MESSQRTFSNIALIGFMGVGKSTCGRVLARALGYDFLDTDQLISKQAGCSISDLFKRQGESVFRGFEHDLVRQVLTQQEHTVISTGGGLGANADNLEALRKNCFIVHLCLSAEGIYERIKSNKNRPLLQTANPLERIRQLLEARLPIYRRADVEISTQSRTQSQIVFQILNHYAHTRGKPHDGDKGTNQKTSWGPRF